MRLNESLRLLYRILDRLAWSRLPLSLQRRSKGMVIELARRLLPGRIPPLSSESLLVDARLQKSEWRRLPVWACEDMADVAIRVTPELNPHVYQAARPRVSVAPVYRIAAGHAYASIRRQVPDGLDTLMIVPWLTRGGADQGVIHYARVCAEVFGHSVAVLATEAQQSPWASRLPKDVPFVDAGGILATLSDMQGEQVSVLARLLLQARPKRIHVVNSRLGWRTIKRHGMVFRGFARIYASLFCDERDVHGLPSGYAVDYLRDVSSMLDGVLTDNAVMPRIWSRRYGLDPALFSVVRFPAVKPLAATSYVSTPDARPRLLWASRLDRQKRPDVLLEIAKRLPEIDFDVHGASGSDRFTPWYRALARQPNVHLYGPFNSFAELIRPEHLAFVYTSDWDGLPLVLLDAIAAGLPVVAPRVGGIPDLLRAEDTVDNAGDIAAGYVSRIETFFSDRSVRDAVIHEQALSLQRHSWPNFIRALAQTPYYTEAVMPRDTDPDVRDLGCRYESRI